MSKALIVHPDDTGEVVDTEINLEFLKGAVGGWVELISNRRWSAYCNEEGKLQGLPVNAIATSLAHQIGWPVGDRLVGTVVFLGPVDANGNDTEVPEFVLDLAFSMGVRWR